MNKYIIILSLWGLIACAGVQHKNIELTDKKIKAYLYSYKELKNVAPDILEKVNTGETNELLNGFKQFENILSNNNLSYSDFIIINAKVGAIYSILQAESFITNMDTLQAWGQNSLNDGIKQMQELINDPEVPKETKEELREKIKELEASKKSIQQDYSSNKIIAKSVLKRTKAISNTIINEGDIQIVEKYFDEISEAYTGGTIPTNYNIY
ncbi:MAG: hypothetical protein HC831_16750 [Chloroflexia bacterium]|nr:hypothetical protein [Chloroflexia bacterium]